MNSYKKIVIYGAGASGVLIKQLYDKKFPGKVIAFVDDNYDLNDRILVGIKIIHSSHFNSNFIQKFSIDAIIVSNIYIHFNKSSVLSKYNLPILLPKDVNQWEDGYISSMDISLVDSSFIINRKISEGIDSNTILKLKNKTIFITGASGSIGGEIVRQLNKIKEISLILIDIDESGLHDLYTSLDNKENCTFHVCDISNSNELERVIKAYKCIDFIFHAAAYKHVHIVENDPYPAIRVNVIGTLNLCKIVDKYSIKNFTMVSTDKAVNPTNIMGVTKRCAELITCHFNYNSNSRFTCTRFGNVIGSRGSAIPLFIKQIKNGGPITLTHANMTRYFMTIPEASQLVIKSSLLENDNGIFLFDMGEPVKLIEIVNNLKIYYNANDLKIKFIGLREGEKMYEELSGGDEEIYSTLDEKINIVISRKPSNEIIEKIFTLIDDYNNLTIDELKLRLKSIIPEYNYL